MDAQTIFNLAIKKGYYSATDDHPTIHSSCYMCNALEQMLVSGVITKDELEMVSGEMNVRNIKDTLVITLAELAAGYDTALANHFISKYRPKRVDIGMLVFSDWANFPTTPEAARELLEKA